MRGSPGAQATHLKCCRRSSRRALPPFLLPSLPPPHLPAFGSVSSVPFCRTLVTSCQWNSSRQTELQMLEEGESIFQFLNNKSSCVLRKAGPGAP